MKKILQQGAEAVIILEDGVIIKERTKKSYRIPEIDEKIRKLRTRGESRLLERASKDIPAPKIFKVDEKNKKIFMDFVDGKKLSENLDSFPIESQKKICEKIGESVAKLHDESIMHGDLTTSNMILKEDNNDNLYAEKNAPTESNKSNLIFNLSVGRAGGNMRASASQNFKVFFIDFGLGFVSPKIEDKAVDLHLLKQALEAKHFKNCRVLFPWILKGYKKSKNSSEVLRQFEKVEQRGRYKEKY